jgi:hypothetical protein
MHFTASSDTGDQIAIAPSSPALKLGPQFTLEAWIYPESSTAGVILGRRNTAGSLTDYSIEIGNSGQ